MNTFNMNLRNQTRNLDHHTYRAPANFQLPDSVGMSLEYHYLIQLFFFPLNRLENKRLRNTNQRSSSMRFMLGIFSYWFT
jgi:hypothetical protein